MSYRFGKPHEKGGVEMPGQNSVVVRRFVEEFQSKHDEAVAQELLAEDFVDGSPPAGLSPDRDGALTLHAALFVAFPDVRVEIHDQIEEGDKVVTRKTLKGTHNGEFMGIAATGCPVAWNVIDILRVRDGKIVEHWNVVDTLALIQQIGAIPTSS
jgi:predicted ester cyclase